MPQSASNQSSFLGGCWGPLSQGRSDHPLYAQALAVNTNEIVTEEGAVARRSGFEFLGTTRSRGHALVRSYVSGDATPFIQEFTDSHLRFYSGTGRVFDNLTSNVTASSLSAGFFSVTVDAIHNLVIGDDVMIFMPQATSNYQLIAPVRNRTLRVTNIVGLVLTLGDDQGHALTGITSNTNDFNGFVVYRVFDLATPWTGRANIFGLRVVQANDKAFILSESAQPYLLSTTSYASGNTDAVFSLATATFKDGPYLDPQGTFDAPETGTVSGYSGSITFTPASTTFTAADVGRHIRLFSTPPLWLSGTTYTSGMVVTDSTGAWWASIASGAYANSNVNVPPGTMLTTSAGLQVAVWAAAPAAGVWAWGIITAQAGSSCTVNLARNPLSANGSTISTWRLGVFKSGQYPTTGLFHEGRLILAGAIANRYDMSISNGLQADGSVWFSPTDNNGIVLDSSGISEVLNANEAALIYWLAPDHQGILMGTLTGEWLISASTLNDPLSPLTIQTHKITRYQCGEVEPVRAGMALVFVQRYYRRVLEYLADAFSGRFTARHLNEYSKHYTETGVFDLAYQEETVPIVWGKAEDGSLVGCTYRRVSRFITEAPTIQAWHKHILGADYAGDINRLVQSLCVTADANTGLSDLLYVSSSDSSDQNYMVEVLRPLLEEA